VARSTVSPGYLRIPRRHARFRPGRLVPTGDLGALDPDGSLRVIAGKRTIFLLRGRIEHFPAFIELQLETSRLSVMRSCSATIGPLSPALLVPNAGASPSLSDSSESALTDAETRYRAAKPNRAAQRALEHYEKIHKFVVRSTIFPRGAGVNIFQKIKVDRKEVCAGYQKEIDEIYCLGQGGQL